MADEELINAATFYIAELRASMIPNVKLYRSGNMQSSVVVGQVGEDFIDIIIGVPYASFTNDRGKWQADAIRQMSKMNQLMEKHLELNKERKKRSRLWQQTKYLKTS